jgi:hypothetical protein
MEQRAVIPNSALVTPEHEQYLLERGFTANRLENPNRVYFSREMRIGYLGYKMLIEPKRFAAGWRVGLQRQWGEGRNWRTVWPAENILDSHAFDDPVTAFVFAEVEEWGGALSRVDGKPSADIPLDDPDLRAEWVRP